MIKFINNSELEKLQYGRAFIIKNGKTFRLNIQGDGGILRTVMQFESITWENICNIKHYLYHKHQDVLFVCKSGLEKDDKECLLMIVG